MLRSYLLASLLLLGISAAQAASLPDSFIELHPGDNYQGQLPENEPLRFYFILEREANILLESRTPDRSNTVYPDAVLFQEDGTSITRDWSSGDGRNFKIERQLPPGTYVLRVEDGRGCGSLHGCPEIIRNFQIIFQRNEVSRF
ncbi:hypothetical protein [Marinospirillum perlucidum]|uniref:hypothetical protein n=1 Tax=Marinospirillum perlucidum TaxID=1982602 RepID=UPI000DF401C2|nr:hypothetical protein [Marinospirillum perlucidum]